MGERLRACSNAIAFRASQLGVDGTPLRRLSYALASFGSFHLDPEEVGPLLYQSAPVVDEVLDRALLARRASLDAQAGEGGDARLRPRHLDCMEALRELGATSEDSLAPPRPLAKCAFGDPDKEEALKEACADLRRWGFTQSKGGRGGGRWLTHRGLAMINAKRP